ncbi:hypothetical protein [Sorangium sp. So ce1151]|uniref:hypothetical protein n=1 Tax=Sorangium sp. So ce1151 TaxID=3133332 RepID=UPI003F604E0A
MNDTRARIVAAAPTVVGLDADPADPDRRRAYIELIAPGESTRASAELANVSGCGLVVAGLWRAAGVKDARLNAPYRPGTAISRLVSIAHTVGAWVSFAAGRFPEPGDMVLVGDNSTGGIEHVFTVTAITVDAQGSAQIESVDGGQRDGKRFETILARSRSWQGSSDTVVGDASRLIIGWINTSLLPAKSPPAFVATESFSPSVARFSAALPDEANRSQHLAPAGRGAAGVDSVAPVTQAAVDLVKQSFGVTPVFWGRYFSTTTTGGTGEFHHRTENAILRAAGIRVAPLARQTTRVGGSEQDGESDGRANAADLIATFGGPYLVAQGGEFFLFLDVEANPSLSADYYKGWCKGLASIDPAITIRPCVYTNQCDDKTWSALNAAAEAGTPCHGLWVAHWVASPGVFQPLGDWRPNDTTPHPAVAAPVLLWQYAGEACDGRFDCDQVNPTLDLEKDLLRCLILPPR